MHTARSATFAALIALTIATPGWAQRGAWSGEWRSHGGDDGHIQYAALDQVNEDNLANLDIVWRWASVDAALRQRHEELQNRSSRIFFHEVTPLKVGDTLYASTALGHIAAIDPGTGVTRWSVDPEVWRAGRPANLGFLSKGLAYWTDNDAERLFYAGGAEATLVSVDPARRALDPNFGDGGKVDLTRDLGPHVARDTYTLTSAPLVAGDVVIVGSSIRDTPRTREVPPGHVRAYDVRSGKLQWTFNTIPNEADYGSQTWEAESWRDAGAVNVWTLMSVDQELGYVYLPVGSEAHNWYGGHRPGDNLFSQSLVCVDAATGERVWHFQLVHHPVWDWDPPAAPTLIDIEVGGRQIKAVAQVTKQGFLFVLDRVTGEPVWPIEERPVQQSTVPGEVTSATQPFPTRPAPFEWQGISEDILIDFTPELHEAALRIMRDQDGGPLYSPPSERGTIVNPGWVGGGSWTGAS
ncbi:MAG: PQQ-binding-like beta-propeller repeat protein, partial [Vicinamibacterales bacterium]|nr:PQQ-binding-like beta-propeller repeat protein [Vicinamibacterales bacterium]